MISERRLKYKRIADTRPFYPCRMREKERTPFGKRVFEARTEAKLTQLQLCKLVGIAQSRASTTPG